jgi:hypothetical protein
MDCGAICLSDRLNLTGDSNRIEYKHSGRRSTGLSSFDYSDETLAHPSTVVGTVQAFACPLKRAPLILDPSEPFFNEIARANYMRAVPFAQQFRKGRFASANRPR